MTQFNAITRPIRKTVEKLKKLRQQHDAAIQRRHETIAAHHQEIAVQKADIVALDAEGARAEATAQKLQELLGA